MRLPTNIKIGGHDYVVRQVKDPHLDGDWVLGMFQANEQRIVLSKKHLANHPSREVEVFLHEILHGIFYNSGILRLVGPPVNQRELEEHVVDATAVGLTAVFKDNPNLIDYVKGRLHG